MSEKNPAEYKLNQWACLVSEGGQTAVLENRVGVVFISQFPDIILYAKALMLSTLPGLVFHIPGPSARWYRVVLRQEKETFAGRFAAVEMALVTPPFALTLRELDILTLIAVGFSNEIIASRLCISFRTVAKHIERLLQKTGFRSRAGLAGYAVDQGYIRLPTPGGINDSPLSTAVIERIAQGGPVDEIVQKARAGVPLRPLTVGIPIIEQGRGEADTRELLQGAELALAEINRQGGIRGRKLRLLTTSYRVGDEKEKIAAYTNMLNNEVDAIISGYACYSPVIHDMVGDSGVPCLHVATLNHAVERVRYVYSNLFQSCATDIHYAVGLQRFIRHIAQEFAWLLASRTLVIVKPTWAELDIGIDYLRDKLHPEGWNIRSVAVLADTQASWNDMLSELHKIQPAVIVLSSFFVEDSICFQEIFHKNPLPCVIYNIYSSSVPLYLQQLEERCNGVVWATTSGTGLDFFGKRFRHHYRNYFNQRPGYSQAGLAYDRVNILAASWSRCVYPRIFPNVVSDLRYSVSRGVNGSYFFGHGQQCLACPDDTSDLSISQAHLICQIQNGKNIVIAPDFCADGEFCLPSWCKNSA
ncbi:ABC transporter substrate-binding protein [Salmonella enterica subsp. enterica serovar Muenchen]|uniref:ABC transporter substrate-binding protein n=2 Tax=Salmonella enterica TaxID=28901 RepID=A0A5I2XAZ0_SALET|nr:ABC transporter substrate-binding protein [Salmonella enterica subsp. enterica serovar Muenchen]EBV7252001.1 ABC transporter substrate-binding protein [Salmonella enterica subsp. enterica serovar Pomona]ECF3886407.1 ABC transporter substrate-binding protein [Salmonella enterica subsp. enterica serovar Ank]QGR34826.1 ABC transporter substrate-binding protein [Salmonella enterica]EEJ1803524.1 ABC transporter substrate-binding protein [Salmonella enterica subsp. enterica serovar Pomona]